jgi:glycosyltransferase involved in cell wall biosynthesis
MGKPRFVLIYCADITGHRHLYSAYMIRFYLDHGCQVFFCYAGRMSKILPSGKKKYEPSESIYLDMYKDNQQVHFRDICHQLNNTKNELKLIRSIQAEIKPDVTFYIDGDILKWVFLRQLLPWQPRLLGRNFCIICLSEFIYFSKGKLKALRELTLFIRSLFSNRRNLVARGDFVRQFPFLNRGFFRCLCRFDLVTTVFCLDLQLVKQLNCKKVLFLPELITASLEEKIPAQKTEFYKKVKQQYGDFLDKHKGKQVLLMFGDLEPRKGFHLLLQLAAHEPGYVCVRFGRTKYNYSATWEATVCKEKLIVEERIFELDIYLESRELIDYIFSTVKFMVLPYRNYLRSSGLLVDVLRRGLPVLTGDKGFMGYIVKHYLVGRVFKEGSFQSLLKEFLIFKDNLKNYSENLKKFHKDFSKKACDDLLSLTLNPDPGKEDHDSFNIEEVK